MDSYTGSSSAPLYTDLLTSSNHIDPNSTKQRDDLTKQLTEYLNEDDLLMDSTIRWSEPYGVTCGEESHQNYTKNVCRFVYQKAKDLMDNSVSDNRVCTDDMLYEESLKHWTRAAELTTCVHGREDVLGRMKDYIVAKTNIPLVIAGNCGQGKSTVLGVAAQSVMSWLETEGHVLNVSVITRFCGHTERSSDTRPFLEDICRQIGYCTEYSIHKLPKEYKNQTAHIRNILQSGNFRGVLILILDGLDQLETVDTAANLDWLPVSLANNVKIILSASSHHNPKVLTNLQKKYPESGAICELGLMHIEESLGMLLNILKQRNRRLTDTQLESIFNNMQEDITPLDIESIAVIASQMASHDTVAAAGTAQACMNHMLDLTEKKYPYIFVTHTLMYLTVADGLSESELYDVLSLDDEVLECLSIANTDIRRFPAVYWARLFTDIKDFFAIKQLDSTEIVYWRHSIFKQVAEKRYCNGKEMAYINTMLTDYYKGRGSNIANPAIPRCSSSNGTQVRQLPQQPNSFEENHQTHWHTCPDSNTKRNVYNERRQHLLPICLIRSNDQIDDMNNDILFNFRWMQSKLKSKSVYAVLKDYEDVRISWEAKLVYGALKMSEVALKDDPDMLSTQLLSRLLHYYHKYEGIRGLLHEADLYGNRLCSYVPNWQSYHSPGAVLEYCNCIDLSEYNSRTGSSNIKLHTIAMETKDKFYLLCKKDSSRIAYTWDILNAFESLQYTAAKGKALYPSPCGEFINSFTDCGTLCLYNTASTQLVYEVQFGKFDSYPSHVALSPRYTAFALPGVPGPHIIDITAGTVLRKLTYQCGSLAFTSDSRMLAIQSGTSVVVIEMPLMTRKCTVDVKAVASQLLFADDHSKIYILTARREVKVIHINYRYKQCTTVEELHCGNVDIQAILLSHDNDMLLISALYSLVVRDLRSSSRIHIKDMPDGPFDDEIAPFTCSGFSSDDAYVVAGRGKYVAVWDTKGRPIRLIAYNVSTITSMFLSKYTNKLLTLHENKALQMWNLENLREDADFNNRTSFGRMNLVANAPFGKKCMTVSTDVSKAVIYNATTNIVEFTIQHGVDVEILAVGVGPNDRLGITVAKNTDKPEWLDEAWCMTRDTKLWDLESGQCIYAITNNVYTVFSPDGYRVVFCPCLEYDLSQPTLKVYNLVLASIDHGRVETSCVELPEGAILEAPVFIHNGRYLCVIICSSSYKTRLCIYSFEGRWKGIRYLDIDDILGNEGEATGNEIVHLKTINENQLLVIIGKDVSALRFDENDCLDISQPMHRLAVLYDVHAGTKLVLTEFLTPDFRLDLSTFCPNAGVYLSGNELWCAKTGTLWKRTRANTEPLQKGRCCLLMGRKYLAVVARSGSSVVIIRTSNMKKETKIQLHGQIKHISTALDDKTLAVACVDTRICLFTLTMAEADSMLDVIMKLPSRKHDVTPTRLAPGYYGIIQSNIISLSWKEMMTRKKINDFRKLTVDDVVDGNGIKVLLS